MFEIIQQNPVVGFFIALVPVVATIWKVMDVLFVKPRDFRISVLEKNVDEIRKQLQKTESEKPGTKSRCSQTFTSAGAALVTGEIKIADTLALS